MSLSWGIGACRYGYHASGLYLEIRYPYYSVSLTKIRSGLVGASDGVSSGLR